MRVFLISFLLIISLSSRASYIFIPMDETQSNHLKSYGLTYWMLTKEVSVDWLLNYRGGSFMVKYLQTLENECIIRGISYEIISDAAANQVLNEIASPANNMDVMKLEKHPKIAVYSPKSKQPWDDAVTLVLTYAEIPYDVIFDDEIMYNELPKYDWLHLHHEDFTGQYGKF
ncbi:MAG: asparagine synthetase B, partial [Cyclobacteriaceae bacterium]